MDSDSDSAESSGFGEDSDSAESKIFITESESRIRQIQIGTVWISRHLPRVSLALVKQKISEKLQKTLLDDKNEKMEEEPESKNSGDRPEHTIEAAMTKISWWHSFKWKKQVEARKCFKNTISQRKSAYSQISILKYA